MVCLANSSYSFRAIALIFCIFLCLCINIRTDERMDSGKLICPSNFRLGSIKIKCICKTQMMPPPDHQNPVSVLPSEYWYMVCPAISPYSFGATALIFSMMFIHIMEVCMSKWPSPTTCHFENIWRKSNPVDMHTSIMCINILFPSNILKMTDSWTFSFCSSVRI
jgi:hypothetical protein